MQKYCLKLYQQFYAVQARDNPIPNAMNEFYCIQVLSNAGETDEDFLARLEDFWDLGHYSLAQNTYAKTPRLYDKENRRVQNYLVTCPTATTVEKELIKAGFDVLPVDIGMVYADYEATPPYWQIL